MSAPGVTSPEATPRAVTALGVTPRRVVRSEWIKLTTLRSTWVTFAVAVALMIGLGLLMAWLTVGEWSSMTAAERAQEQAGQRVLAGRLFAQLAIGVLGVIAVTGEYATGMIRATLAAVPRRLPVLWAKLGLFGTITFVLMSAASFAAFFAGNEILSAHWQFSLSDPGALRVVVMTGVTLTAVCLLGTALGFVLRNTAAAISAIVSIVLVLPILGEFAPRLAQYLPSGAMGALVTPTPEPDVLAPGPALVLLCAYVAAAIAAAAFVLTRRDA